MARLKFTKPCNDCPFRLKSMPGWTGLATPEELERLAWSEDSPCHQTVDYTDPDWLDKLEDVALCAGALAYLGNLYYLPRDPIKAEAVKACKAESGDKVFDGPQAFLKHHWKNGVGSWGYSLGRRDATESEGDPEGRSEH